MVAQIDKELLKKRLWKVPGRIMCYLFIEGRPLTTKGRFINPLVFAGFKIANFLPLFKRDTRPIFIVGTGRSGTTILGKLFAIHRQTVFLNEPKAVWHFAHSEEDIIGNYSKTPGTFRLNPNPNQEKKMAITVSKIYQWASLWGLSERVVDKYPEMVFRVGFLLNLLPKSKIIIIVRDGVDTVSSVKNWSERKGVTQGDETHDWWGRNDQKWKQIVCELVPEHPDLAHLSDQLIKTDNHHDRAAVEWIVSMREALKVSKQHNQSVFFIKYEELCTNPTETLVALQSECGLDRDTVFENYAKTILSKAEDYKPLELNSELLPAFSKTLSDMGYDSSIPRVRGHS